MSWMYDLVTNPVLLTSVSAWLVAQVLKVIIHAFTYKKMDISRLFGDGGMPSGHSATVSSLATICALLYGTGSVYFAMGAILATIVCHDALGVRRETGKQAVIINELIKDDNTFTKEKFAEIKLKEFVGHTPMQVFMGILLGIVHAFVMFQVLC